MDFLTLNGMIPFKIKIIEKPQTFATQTSGF